MPLQKSFSDQNHSSRQQRPQWKRNKTYHAPDNRHDRSPPRDLSKKLPIPVSTATKNRLNSFQFSKPVKEVAEEGMEGSLSNPYTIDEKENIPVQEVNGNIRQSSQHSEISKRILDAPRTPCSRVALPDLISMVDVGNIELSQTTPDDGVSWKYDPHATGSSMTSQNRTQRGKKRARSSSPVPSPAAHTSSYFLGKQGAFDLQPLNVSLKTPQAGPGPDLWDRYALESDKAAARAAQNPALAHIMDTSSPRHQNSEAFGIKASTLKRSISCGDNFPKRRRVILSDDKLPGDVFSESVNAGPSKLSLVRGLLDKVQEGYSVLPKSRSHNGPSSSSPAPRSKNIFNSQRSSPLKNDIDIHCGGLGASSPSMRITKPQRASQGEEEPPVQDSGSSDYGEFDDDIFDESMVEAITSNPTSKSHSRESTQVHIYRNAAALIPAVPATQVERKPIRPKIGGSVPSASIGEAKDEFDDSDDEIFAADLEEIVSKYDSQLAAVGSGGSVNAGNEMAVEALRGDLAAGDTGSDDDFDDGFDDNDFALAEAAATQSLQQPASSVPQPSQKVKAIQRYLVTNVIESQYQNSKGRLRPEKVLLVQVENTKAVRTIILRDGWIETPVTTKAYVHVIGEFESGQCIVDDLHNIIILHPDHLISSTVVADSFSCTRRAVLQDRVKATNDSSAPLVYGTILHQIFQDAMTANRWDTQFLNETIDTVTSKHLEDLYTIKLQIPQAVEYLRSKMGELQSWAELFVSSKPNASATVKAGNGETALMCVSKLLDVEEHVWSPNYGLKGNIDATVQVTMQDGKTSRTLTVPFEVKTGKGANAAHRAQTALYNLLLSDRYDIEIACGILYYMETSETIRIPSIRHELRHMIMQRNELACFVREKESQLPPMLKKESLCNRCYAKVPCFIYHRLSDNGDGETSGLKEKFDEVVKHLTPKHKEFFLKWDNLLTKEEKESLKFRRELWTMLSTEREKLGRCFANVIIEPGSAYEELNNPKINRYRYTLIKQNPPPGFSFIESQIAIGEPIVISDEKGHFALANGYVTNVRKNRITVAVDRRLHNARIRQPGFDEKNNQAFASIMEVAPKGSKPDATNGKITEAPVLYRLDKDEFSNGMATVRNNIIQIMSEGAFGSREIRSLVVDLVVPKFKPHSTAYTLTDRANINIDQRRAIEKVMSARDYALVLGMPGTGKTTTIAHIIRALVSQGKSVLLTSYTHTAVDNILLKLRDDKIPILRLGAIAKIAPGVQEFADLAAKPKETFEQIRSSWHDSPVVATTCLGINHPLFNERTFDYCIVDEASQITLPVCLGPIRMARTFVLVGDHNQLPPLVQNEEARVGGLDISLFKHLSDMHPSSVVNLEHQYRMCEEVMTLSNNLIYDGRLKCGTPEVAARSIYIPNIAALKAHHFNPTNLSQCTKSICPAPAKGACWLRDLLSPSAKARFVNTDPLLPLSREEAKGNRIVNPTEVTICVQLVESLLSVGIPASSIGVMTHYRSQLSLLKNGLRAHPDVEMHTADRFQGRDKEVIILSLVRSNEAKSIGELLKDWRRINVAFTRAKTKLLVVGSRETLKGNGEGKEEMVARFVGLMEDKGWVYELPRNALESHCFVDAATQATATAKSARPDEGVWKAIDCCKNRQNMGAKENHREPKRAVGISEGMLLRNKPVLRDIMNDVRG